MSGAAGMVIMFHVDQDQVESYFEPHQGMHYQLPAVRILDYLHLRRWEVAPATTRNIIAILPGQTEERVIFETHNNGYTYVQENGPVALLALTQDFAKQPLSSRKHTIEFAFNTRHLHISKEVTLRHFQQLDRTFDDKKPRIGHPG
ncbi:hypothetical protein BU25DRAFT_468720 [Macroventuria anomochaeta]|uniref:Uncharacterized protein n=1 Tax=Macroventuria anomochaeta TaxID=301207 RepID=A0ACB6S3G4_9PLEO|nr:uncharacterized protein BU25DRAFT_468720 [Macroventuria anomochaeta]KAF2627682.1 hypothetical protein BU25DRAFT_468720 [Macroventuria anomochaeta]